MDWWPIVNLGTIDANRTQTSRLPRFISKIDASKGYSHLNTSFACIAFGKSQSLKSRLSITKPQIIEANMTGTIQVRQGFISPNAT